MEKLANHLSHGAVLLKGFLSDVASTDCFQRDPISWAANFGAIIDRCQALGEHKGKAKTDAEWTQFANAMTRKLMKMKTDFIITEKEWNDMLFDKTELLSSITVSGIV